MPFQMQVRPVIAKGNVKRMIGSVTSGCAVDIYKKSEL